METSSAGSQQLVITRFEWKWVLIVAFLTLLASSLPMLVGYAVQTPEQRFMGTLYDRADYFTNLAKIQLGLRGEYRYQPQFTSEPVSSEPILYYYITLGAVGRLFGLSATFMYEFSRLLGGLVELVLIYKFTARFTEEISLRRLIFLLAITASGLGWLLIFTPAFSFPNQSPMDFWLADGYLIFSLMGFSHFTWSLAALLAALLAWLDYADNPTPWHLFWLLAFSTLLSFIQIFEIVLLDVVIALDGLGRLYTQRRLFRAFVVAVGGVGLLQLLAGLPFVFALRTNSLLQLWSYQGRTLSPAPQYFLEGYGLLWLLVAAGLAVAWRSHDKRWAFPALWLAGVALIIYTPNTIQYRWLLGVEVPIAALAGLGFAKGLRPWLVSRLPVRWQTPRATWWFTSLALILFMPSTLYVVGEFTFLASVHWKEAFVSGGQVAAIDWLQANTQREEIVLANLKVGGALPGWIGQHTYFGHFAETIDFDGKQRLIQRFFSDMPDSDRRTLLRANNIHYIYYGPDEQGLGYYDPSVQTYLTRRFQSGDTTIYQVVDP